MARDEGPAAKPALITAPIWSVRVTIDAEIQGFNTDVEVQAFVMQQLSPSMVLANAMKQVAVSAEPAAEADKRRFLQGDKHLRST